MKRSLLALLGLASLGLNAQVVFDEELTIQDWEPQEVLLPPSPLKLQPIFVGGHDIVQTTPTYGNPAGRAIAKEWHDFIGWTPDESGETLGWATVNHEMVYADDRLGDGGGMTTFRLRALADGTLEVVPQTITDTVNGEEVTREGEFFNVDFVNTVGETGMNCAGISAPNGRIWTAEEWWRGGTSDIWNGNNIAGGVFWLPKAVNDIAGGQGVRDTSAFTIDAPEFADLGIDGMTIPKYQNFNFMVEVDPRRAKAIRKQYNWGRAGWEGGAISADGRYVYLGDDATPAPFVRIEANTPWDFTDVKVAVFKENNPADQRWVEIPRTAENIFEDIRQEAWDAGATMYVRNEWVAIDHSTGIVYWAETGRESTSSGPGTAFISARDGVSPSGGSAARYGVLDGEPNPDVLPSSAHYAWADSVGIVETPFDEGYQDYYGRIHWYNPETHETGVAIHGGPFFAEDPSIEEYPDKHLSNPDGLKVIDIQGEKYLMINEDLNQSDWGSTPSGVSNRLCELFILPISAISADQPASVDDLIRLTAIARGAEVTGSIQISPDAILFNSQHPNSENPFPYNHSLTMALTGLESLSTSLLSPAPEDFEGLDFYPNPATRSIFLNEVLDVAIYDVNGKRIRVVRDAREIDVSDLDPGMYFIVTPDKKAHKLVVQ